MNGRPLPPLLKKWLVRILAATLLTFAVAIGWFAYSIAISDASDARDAERVREIQGFIESGFLHEGMCEEEVHALVGGGECLRTEFTRLCYALGEVDGATWWFLFDVDEPQGQLFHATGGTTMPSGFIDAAPLPAGLREHPMNRFSWDYSPGRTTRASLAATYGPPDLVAIGISVACRLRFGFVEDIVLLAQFVDGYLTHVQLEQYPWFILADDPDLTTW